MSWVRIGQFVNLGLGLILMIRLLYARLERVYSIFCMFLAAEFIASLLSFLKKVASHSFPDYRIMWLAGRAVIWVFTLWTVYALLDAVLAHLPGLLRFSRKLLNTVFVLAVVFGMLTARPEYSVSGLSGLGRAAGIGIVLDRVVSTIALLALLSILGFLLWFPVEISKNLIVFATGFLVYFSAKGALMLSRSLWSHDSLNLVSNIDMLISGACFAYWAIFISPQGEMVSIKMGHSWRAREQERLLGQLEAMNVALLRTAARR